MSEAKRINLYNTQEPGEGQNYFDVEAVSNSLLGEVKRKLKGEIYRPPLAAFKFGRGLHECVLEPHNFNAKDFTNTEQMKFLTMRAKLLREAPALFKGEKELELYYNYLGWKCKVKIDVLNTALLYAADLKTTAANSQEEFEERAMDYNYHRQAAWYLDAQPVKNAGVNTWLFIAISKTKPYNIFKMKFDRNDVLIESGRQEYKTLLTEMELMMEYNKYKA